MTNIAFPVLSRSAPSRQTWRLIANTQSFESPFNKSVQTTELPGMRWGCELEFDNLEQIDASLLQAHVAKLRGMANRSLVYNFMRPNPRGSISGTPLVKGAAQVGTTLLVDGASVGTTVKTGDFFAVNGELKMLVADATVDGLGEVTLIFEPALRSAPGDNAPVSFNQATAAMMLRADETQWADAPGLVTTIALAFIEAFAL